MTTTRLPTDELRDKIARALQLLAEIDDLLEPVLVPLTDDQRKSIPRPPTRFADAGRSLAELAGDAPNLAALAQFHPEAVVEDLANALLLAPLAARMADVVRRIDDTRLKWNGEAYVPALRLYRLARACADADGRMDELVRPLKEVFAAVRRRRKPRA